MRKQVLSCVVAGALVFSTPLVGSVALAEDSSHVDELRKVSQSLENTYLGNQVDKLLAQIDAGVSPEEQAAIEAQIEKLLAQAAEEGLLPESALDQAGITPEGSEEGESDVEGEGPAEDVAPSAPVEDEGSNPEKPGGETDIVPPAEEVTPPAEDEGKDPEVPPENEGEEEESGEPETPEQDVPVTPSPEPTPDVPQTPETPQTPAEPSAPEPEDSVPQESATTPPTTLPLVPEANSFDSGEVPRYNYAEDMDTEKFIALIGEQARSIAQEHDLYASVMIAQAILESASGKSELSQAPNNNLFGIKGAWEDENGKKHSVSFLTSEDDGTGSLYQIVSGFRAYDTLADSLEDYAQLLTDDMGTFYQGAWKKNAETYTDAAQWLEGRYATDTHYAEKLVGLIETYELDRFDEELSWTPVDEDVDLTDLLAEATSHLGTAYTWGGASPLTGFDCSGLVQWAYKEALDIDLPRTTYEQCLEGELVPFDDLHPGDLLFFEDGGDVHHVALYLGDGFYLHAPQQGEPVKVTSMEEYEPDFARRIVPTRPVEEAPVVSKVLVGLKGLLPRLG